MAEPGGGQPLVDPQTVKSQDPSFARRAVTSAQTREERYAGSGGELDQGQTASRPAYSPNFYNGKELAAGHKAHHVHINRDPPFAPEFLEGMRTRAEHEEPPEMTGKIILSCGRRWQLY